SKLQVQVFDFELLQTVQVCPFDLLVSGGLRLAHVNQRYDEYAVVGAAPEFSLSGNSFHGVGPTVALEAHRPVGRGALAIYGTARGSILFGSYKQAEFTHELDGGGPFDITFLSTKDKVVGVAELELGVEAGRRMGSTRLFGQVGIVGQEWVGTGTA